MTLRTLLFSSLCLAGVLSVPAEASDLIVRKPGLWDVSTTMEGAPTPIKSQMCIDAQTDQAMMKAAMGSSCEAPRISGSGNIRTIDSVCRIGDSTVNAHTVITYASSASYQLQSKNKYSPALYGKTEGGISQNAIWVGACPAEMQPGDVLSNGIKINVLAAMKAP